MGITGGSALHQQSVGLQENVAPHLGQVFMVPLLLVSICTKLSQDVVLLLRMQLIVITPDKDIENEALLVNEMFALGLERLHLRKPGYTKEDYERYIQTIDPAYHARIIVHAHYELFHEYQLGGIHLNSMVRDDATVWAQVATIQPHNISTSFHSWAEIADNEFAYSYVFISPVFNSISKKDYEAAISPDGAKALKQTLSAEHKYCPRIIGLGGVGEPQLATLAQHGFDGAATIGAVWLATDPVAAFMQMIETTSRL
jgi:thiamine-phosphate pyrophosphorylase